MSNNDTTTAQHVTADFVPGEFWDGDDRNITEVAEDQDGYKVVGLGEGRLIYRFADGSALLVSKEGWALV